MSAHSMQATVRFGGLQLSLFESESHISTTPAYTPDNGVYNEAAFNENSLFVASGSFTRSIKHYRERSIPRRPRVNRKRQNGERPRHRSTTAARRRRRSRLSHHFIAADSRRTADVILRVARAGVLTVGETPEFLQEGGVIQFYIRDNRVRFQINAAAGNNAGLKISSQLLSLSK